MDDSDILLYDTLTVHSSLIYSFIKMWEFNVYVNDINKWKNELGNTQDILCGMRENVLV